jgi:hypothetical protein
VLRWAPDDIQIYDRSNYDKENIMKLTAPKIITWWIAVILGVLGILGKLTTISFVSANAFWFVVVGFVLLALATFFKGL